MLKAFFLGYLTIKRKRLARVMLLICVGVCFTIPDFLQFGVDEKFYFI